MSKHVSHVPKHRAPSSRTALVKAPKHALRSTLVLSSLAVVATGTAVSGGVLAGEEGTGGDRLETAAGANTLARGVSDRAAEAASAERAPAVSRDSDRREGTDPAKEATLSVEPGGGVTGEQELSPAADPRDIARALLSEYGFSASQFGCLDSLYVSESNWNPSARNPYSGAYGIPQSLPASKMAAAGSDYLTNPVTQIKWGLGYIQDRYGTPCSAWSFKQGHNWY